MSTARRLTNLAYMLVVVATAVLVSAASAHAGRHTQAHGYAAFARAAVSPNATTYPDPTGDGGTARDITSVVVSNDAAGRLTFRVNLVRLATPADGIVVIAIDSDQNAATGYHGFDFMFVGDLATSHFAVARWNGSGFYATHMSSATAGSDDTGLTFSVDGSEVRAATGFNFFVRTVAGNGVAAGNHDDAPDSGEWTYRLDGAAVLTLTVERSSSTKARAGKPFIAFVTVGRSDGQQAEVTYGEVTCTATAGGRLLRATAIPTYGPAAGCSWRLPKRSRGQALRAAITVTVGTATVTRTFTARIR